MECYTNLKGHVSSAVRGLIGIPDKITKKRSSVKIPQWDRLAGVFDQFQVKFNTRSILSASSSNKVCFMIFILQHSFGFIFVMRVYILILKKKKFGEKKMLMGNHANLIKDFNI